MSAAASPQKSHTPFLSRGTELEATREISRTVASVSDPSTALDEIIAVVLDLRGVRRVQLEHASEIESLISGPLAWGAASDNSCYGSAVADISAGGMKWGDLRLYFDLQPSTLESPHRFAKFLSQQIAMVLNAASLEARRNSFRQEIACLTKIVVKRKAIHRAKALIAGAKNISEFNALALMCKHSRDSGRTLHQVAEAFIFNEARNRRSEQGGFKISKATLCAFQCPDQ